MAEARKSVVARDWRNEFPSDYEYWEGDFEPLLPLDALSAGQGSLPASISSPNGTELCDLCTALVTYCKSEGIYEHHNSLESLARAAVEGCALCAQVWENFSDGARHLSGTISVPRTTKFACHFNELNVDTQFYCFTEIFLLPFEENRRPAYAYTKSDRCYIRKLRVLDEDTRNEIVEENTGSETSLHIAKRWLDDCIAHHSECAVGLSRRAPRRLLHVGTSSQPCLRLFLTHTTNFSSSYTTLSHCWGKLVFIQLRKGSLESMTEGILLEDLPKTFRDAIRLTRALAVQYIWIDSLCIIQDSTEDWQEQSAEMAQIYSNSICNIAALFASDGNGGCFRERNRSLAKPCRIRTDESNLGTKKAQPITYDLVDFSNLHKQMTNSPLLKRGWVLQEQYLNSRTVYCGQSQLFWGCQRKGACETYPEELPPVFHFHHHLRRVRASPPDTKDQILLDSTSRSVAEISPGLQRWNVLVGHYTRRKLTKEEDILVAISGVAKELGNTICDAIEPARNYLAGLWRSHLPLQLLWAVLRNDSSISSSRPSIYRAPTWSWASVIGEIYTSDAIFDPNYVIRILAASTKLVGQDPMGQVSGGSIVLNGWIKSISTRRIAYRSWSIGGRIVCSPDVEDEMLGRTEVIMFPIIRHSNEMHGLMIDETTSEGIYKRLGTFEISLTECRREPLPPAYANENTPPTRIDSFNWGRSYRTFEDWTERTIELI